jgi:hypothetical protein
MSITLVPVLVNENGILKALKGNSVANKSVSFAVLRNDFNAGGRNIEADIRSLDDEQLAVGQVELIRSGRQNRRRAINLSVLLGFCRLDFGSDLCIRVRIGRRNSRRATGSDCGLGPVLNRQFRIINTNNEVFVEAKLVTLDGMSLLTGPQSEVDRTRNIDTPSVSKARSRVAGGPFLRELNVALFGRILKDQIVAFGGLSGLPNSICRIGLGELILLRIISNELVLLRQRERNRANSGAYFACVDCLNVAIRSGRKNNLPRFAAGNS